MEQKLDQSSRKSVLADIKLRGSKIRTLGGQGTPYGASPYQSPASSPFPGRRAAGVVSSGSIDEGDAERVGGEQLEQNPLLLSRVNSVAVPCLCSLCVSIHLQDQDNLPTRDNRHDILMCSLFRGATVTHSLHVFLSFQVESLNKALSFSLNENFRLKMQIAKVCMRICTYVITRFHAGVNAWDT